MGTTTIKIDERTYGQLLRRALPQKREGWGTRRRYPIRKGTPQQTLRHLLEARNLTQKDLWKVFGSKGITSEVFHKKSSISKAQAKKLAASFHVSAELFI